jgi:hypothetical protein
MSTSITPDSRTEGLRERHAVSAIIDRSSSGVSSGQDTPQNEDEAEKEMKTFGRTPDGTSTFFTPLYYPSCLQAALLTYHSNC